MIQADEDNSMTNSLIGRTNMASDSDGTGGIETQLIEQFIALYQELNANNLNRLGDVYSQSIVFQDPLHQMNGLQNLQQYFAELYRNINSIHFDIRESLITDGQANLFWQMSYVHPKLNRGKTISVDGMSQLKFDQKITFHRDYFDLGQMLYEPIPVLGMVIRKIKSRVTK